MGRRNRGGALVSLAGAPPGPSASDLGAIAKRKDGSLAAVGKRLPANEKGKLFHVHKVARRVKFATAQKNESIAAFQHLCCESEQRLGLEETLLEFVHG